jgi:arylsulfatase A-like enzyme
MIAWGKGIRSDARFNTQPNLRDIAPTALVSLGCPLTVDMDGRCLEEIFSDAPDIQRRGSSYKESIDQPDSQVYQTSEEAAIRERLRALGYIE